MNASHFSRLSCVWLIANLLALLAAPVAAQSPTPLPNPNLELLTNGIVSAIALQPDGGVVFGGYFTGVKGTPRENIARLLPDGTLDMDWNPSSNGRVHALAVDASGAVYAGGSFTSIGGQERNSIAKLSGSGSGAADVNWNPSANAEVLTLAVDASGALYAGGYFTSIDGQDRTNIAKLSGSGAVVASWNPSPNGDVSTLAVDVLGAVYVGGSFTSIGGQSRNRIAKLSGSGNGAANASWNPSANGYVSALAVIGNGAFVYVGGSFTSIGGQSRNRIAKLPGSGTGMADVSWNPSANYPVRTLSIDTSGAVYAGGDFTNIGGQSRSRIAKLLGTGSGAAYANWNPSVNDGVSVETLSVDASGMVYAGGQFTNIDGQTRLSFAKITPAGSSDAAIDAEAAGCVYAIGIQPGGGVIVGGQFQKANSQPRANLLRLNVDGTLDQDWNPSANNHVRTLAVDASGAIYAGGWFTSIGGQTRNRIAKLSGSGNGAADVSWNPSPNGDVSALAVDVLGMVYVGGSFTSIGGQLRNRIAKLSGSGNGAADASWNPSANDYVHTLTVDTSGAIYVGGSFSSIGGRSRSRIAKLSGSGIGVADANWDPSPNREVLTLAVDASGAVYVGGYFSGIGGQSRNHIAKLSGSGSGAADASWNPSANSYVYTLAVDTSGAAYAGGLFTSIGGESRNRIARLSGDGVGAADASWNPSANGRFVNELALGAGGALYAGGDFTSIGGQTRHGIAAIPQVELDHIFSNGFELP